MSTELEAYSAADADDDCIALENYCTWGGVSIEKLAMARRFPSILQGLHFGKIASRGRVPCRKIRFLEEEPSTAFPPPPYPSVFPPVITVHLRVPFLY